jgi:hypothetical protein
MKWWLELLTGLIVGGVGFAAANSYLTSIPWALEFIDLLIAGGFGGLVQALFSGGDRLRFPGWVPSAEEDGRPQWDAGFLADVCIGMLGATASLLFALALLSDRFFGATGNQPADIPIPPWARIVAFGGLAGFASRQLLPSLSKRLSDMVAEQVKQQTAAVEKKATNQVEAVRAQAEAARLAAAAVKPAPPVSARVQQARGAVAAAPPPAGATPGLAELEQLVTDYAAINIADYDARVAARMEIAEAMLAVADQYNITSQDIYQQIQAKQAKEWVLPLATVIAAQPTTGDARRLLDAYDLRLGTPAVRVESKFILYRVLLALVALRENRRLPAAEKPRARGVAEACREINDPSLQKRADAVLSLLA